MAYGFPEGSAFYFSPLSSFASAVNVTAVTNANPAVATAASHGYVDDDIVLFNSGWEDATDALYKVDMTDASTFSFLGLDTSNTTFFAAGAGTGTTQKVTTWTSIPQVLTIATQGGDARFTTISPLSRRNAINVPTGFNATTITLTLGYDPTNANYQTMLGISRALSKVGFKMALSGSGVTYGFGYMSVSEVPQLNVNQPNQVTAVLTLLGKALSYSS